MLKNEIPEGGKGIWPLLKRKIDESQSGLLEKQRGKFTK